MYVFGEERRKKNEEDGLGTEVWVTCGGVGWGVKILVLITYLDPVNFNIKLKKYEKTKIPF